MFFALRNQLDALEKLLRRLKDDIARKENSLRLDSNCLELRHTRMRGSGRLEGKHALHCSKLLEGHKTGDETVCEATKLHKVPTYSKLDPVASVCAGQTC